MNTIQKVVTQEVLVERIKEARDAGRTIALANGLFDILHVGHLRYLESAAQEADLLVVAINADTSARALKGPDRPMTPEAERAELIAGFACVDHAVIFSELSVEPLLTRLRPDVHCKGTDYTAETVPEAALANKLGIRIAIVGDPKNHASREIVARIRSSKGPE